MAREEVECRPFSLPPEYPWYHVEGQDHQCRGPRRTGSNTLFYILTQRRLRWLGHVRRMPCGRLPKDILYGELAIGRRDLGRPKLRFKDVVKRDLWTARLDEEWESMALQRPQWRKAVTHASAQCETQYIERLALHSRKRKNPPQDFFQGPL